VLIFNVLLTLPEITGPYAFLKVDNIPIIRGMYISIVIVQMFIIYIDLSTIAIEKENLLEIQINVNFI
jgi:hypothetical protein